MPLGKISRKDEGYCIDTLLKEIRSCLRGGEYGALITFVGAVRGKTPKGSEVTQLEYEMDEETAGSTLQRIACDLSRNEGVKEVVICH
ncbi:MAG: molybdenum cofactor biosynthesis protein MoaE, partial [Candidatus Verstraetearchaeota archaeon]|nr:molybdenum cofactor biosynthesis protein MoaE [Candidatus Verstraetearchaeota archaeon]